jgi:transposase
MVSLTGVRCEPAPSIIEGTTMEHYPGIDVSLETSCVCVVDGTGRVICEAKVASEPEALIAWFCGRSIEMARIGLEAGPLSQWLYAEMRAAGLAVELLESRHVRDAFKAMPVKTDRKDARGIAQLMRLGWFRPVHCKSLPAQEMRALLTARKQLQSKLHDIEMNLRGTLHGQDLRTPGARAGIRTPDLGDDRRCDACSADHAGGAAAAAGEAGARYGPRRCSGPAADVGTRCGADCRLTYVAAIDDPARFKSSKATGAHFGLASKKYQSGETNVTGRISKVGDPGAHTTPVRLRGCL